MTSTTDDVRNPGRASSFGGVDAVAGSSATVDAGGAPVDALAGPTEAESPGNLDWTGAFEALTDLVVVLDAEARIAYTNRYGCELLGWELDAVIGHHIADFVHVDDLVRAVEVLGLLVDRTIGVSVTPAVYRLRRSDGSWCPVEVNGAPFPAAGPERTMLVGRYLGDQDIQNRILHALMTGASTPDAIDLVPNFGIWRHPEDHYAVACDLDSADPLLFGTGPAVEMLRASPLDGPWAVAARTGVEQKVPTEQLAPGLRAVAARYGLTSCWAIPVTDVTSRRVAVAVVWTRLGGPTTAVHVYAMQIMCRSLELILRWGQQVSDLERAARHDSLTGTLNRNRFFELLGSLTARSGRTVAVLYADLDGFKVVNDVHGHAVGDAVLREVAARLSATIDARQFLSRIGGDEFAVLCPGLVDPQAAAELAAQMVAVIEHPVEVGDLRLEVGLSVGVATALEGTVAPDALVEQADDALYAAKSAGRGCWRLSEVPAAQG